MFQAPRRLGVATSTGKGYYWECTGTNLHKSGLEETIKGVLNKAGSNPFCQYTAAGTCGQYNDIKKRTQSRHLLKLAGGVSAHFWTAGSIMNTVGFAIRSSLLKALCETPCGISPCLMKLQLALVDGNAATFINCYAPKLCSTQEEKDSFYEQLSDADQNNGSSISETCQKIHRVVRTKKLDVAKLGDDKIKKSFRRFLDTALATPQHLKQIAADLNTLLNQIKPAVETSKSNNIFGLSNNTSLPITQSNPWATNGTKKPSNQLSEAEQWLNSTASHIDPFAAAPNVLGLKNQQLQQQQQQLLMNQPQQLLAQNLAQQQLLQQQRQLLASLSNSTSLEQPVTGFQTTSLSTTGSDIPLQQPSKSFQNHQPNQQSLSTQLQLLQLQQTLQQQKMQQQQQPQLKQTLQQLQQTLQKQLQQSPTKLLQQSKQQKPFQQPLNNLTLQQQLQQQQLVQIQQQLQQQIQLQELKQLELQLQLQQQQKCKLGGLNQSNNHNSEEDDQSSDDIVLQIQQNQTSLEMNRKQLLSNLQQQLLLSNGSS
ncbi:hypothetical protein HELRODRAFT_160294 [Helobdella robusta]|uniref:Uncharacterized protein n=1 Tax=Helobdella robusta TaxID=6412 RepID=T1EQ22_HELRO|nr:hypothetical protein HELRODRAFT_160294 [Helobdella robusta]ESO06147.1 hypothetical protein HELRODRAFT_160294 [Helobdella robusta]